MKCTIITVCRNAADTILDALESVAGQDHDDIEHIVVDGNSDDGTQALVNGAAGSNLKLLSEPDNGIYDAMNKGIGMATGDIIGFLNADDVYEHASVLTRVAGVMATTRADACYADLVYVRRNDVSRVVRYWTSRDHVPGLSFTGWMPAHPTFFARREVYERHGRFDTKLKIQADLELTARLLEVHCISSVYVPETWVRMRMGGVTNRSLVSMWQGNRESYLALKRHGLDVSPARFLPQSSPSVFPSISGAQGGTKFREVSGCLQVQALAIDSH